MISRREAREQAFILIFEKMFNSDEIENLVELAKESLEIEIDDYAVSTAQGVYEKLEEIDPEIEKYCKGRKLTRLSKTVLALLRLSVYEIKFVDEVDAAVSINEAVELAKKYSGNEEAGYINGVLGSFVRAGEMR